MKFKDSKKGWVLTKNDKPINTPNVTKKGLLIDYDMMSLRGLRKAEKDLRTPPYDIRRVFLEYDPHGNLYGCAVDGQISLKFAAFSNLNSSIEKTRMDTAFAIRIYMKNALTEQEYKNLSSFYYFNRDIKNPELPEDKRRKNTLLKLGLETKRIFKKLKIEIVPVKYVLVR